MARIVIDARPINSSTGRYLRKLVENLAVLDRNNEYTVLVWPDFDSAKAKLPPNFSFQTADYPVSGSFREQLGFLRQLNKLKADLVHFGMTQQPVLYKRKKVTTIHDLSALRFVNPAKKKLVFKSKQGVYARVIKRVAQSSSAIITPSKFVKHDVAQYAKISPDKIFVTYEAADKITAAAKPLPRLSGKPFIMYVGRATAHKNLSRLVEAFEILHKTYPKLMLVLAGKTDTNYKRIGQLVSDKRLAHSVVFTDHVSEGELRWLYEHAAAYVFPSLSEGFGLPGLEAMVHGAPVVSSSATCLPEVYGDAAHYFDPLNVKDMAEAIGEVLANPKIRTELIKKGRAQAAAYSWRRMARQTLDIYSKVLNR